MEYCCECPGLVCACARREGSKQQADRKREGGLYSRKFEKDRRGDWLFRMQTVMTRDDDGGGGGGGRGDANMYTAPPPPAPPPPKCPFPNDVSLSPSASVRGAKRIHQRLKSQAVPTQHRHFTLPRSAESSPFDFCHRWLRKA